MDRPRSPVRLSRVLIACAPFFLTAAPALAQSGVKTPAANQLGVTTTPSPFAPTTLKAPIFNTQTPVYTEADQRKKAASTVVAEVDGRAITLGDVRDYIAQTPPTVQALPFQKLFPIVLNRLILEQALVIRAQHIGLDEDPDIRRKMREASDLVLATALLEKETSKNITEADLLARYQKEVAGKPGPEEAHVHVIMVGTREQAAAIIAQLQKGADFATLARKDSEDPTAPAGGDAGFLTREAMTPAIGAVVFDTPPHSLAPYPVRDGNGWFILKVGQRLRGPAPPYSEVRSSLKQAMMQKTVAPLMKAILSEVTIREYDINGKQTQVVHPQ